MSAQSSIDELLHQVFSGAPSSKSSEFSEDFYRVPPPPIDGYFDVETPFVGVVDGQQTNKYKIAYTQWGDRGPVVLFLHGVPTNRTQYFDLQKRLAPFCQTYSIDMLGMGESSHPLNYGRGEIRDLKGFDWVRSQLEAGDQPWSWIFDTIYIEQIHRNNFGDNSIVFVADDWGAGILSHYAARRSDKLAGAVWIDPIAFDGYPVSEIQAFGRASQLDDEQFAQAMGAADQTMVQIFKTMVYDPNVWNQYKLRNIKRTYIDVDYERQGANSLTLGLKMNALRVLADRAAVLSPDLLLPYHSRERPLGVKYSQITCPSKVIWGMQDNMMPERQIWRFLHALVNARVTVHSIANAGHFAAVDQPDEVAESLMGFLLEDPDWRPLMGDVFLGFGGKHRIYKGDEREVVQKLRDLYSRTASPSASPSQAVSPSPMQSISAPRSPSPIQTVSVSPSRTPSPRSVQVASVSPSRTPSPRSVQVASVSPSRTPSPRSVQVASVSPSRTPSPRGVTPVQTVSVAPSRTPSPRSVTPVLSTPPVTQITQPSTVVSPASTSVTYVSSGSPSQTPSPRTSVTVLSPTPRASSSPSPRSSVSPVSSLSPSQQSPPSPTGTMTPTAMIAPQTTPSPVSITPRSAVSPVSTIAAVPPSPRVTPSPVALSAPLSPVSSRSPSPRMTASSRPMTAQVPSPVSIPPTTTTTSSSASPQSASIRPLSPVIPRTTTATVSAVSPTPVSPRSVASPVLVSRPATISPRPVMNMVTPGSTVTSPRTQSLPPLTLGNTQVSPTVVSLSEQ